jgi:hypothetical protein
MNAEQRLRELGMYARTGAMSSNYSGSKLFQQMMEGGGAGIPGAKVPNFVPYVASRVAETARAVASLTEDEQATVFTVYLADLPHRAQQASSLGVKANALCKRLQTIRRKVQGWLDTRHRARSDKFFIEPQKVFRDLHKA